jgi:hypothetical protein
MAPIPRWHFSMLNDVTRNQSFEIAIQKVVRTGDHVVDIGAGTGLLSLLAVRHGAARAEAFECEESLVKTAVDVIAKHGQSTRITVHPHLSHHVELPPDQRGDVLITEIFDCCLVGEGIIPSLRAARRTLLKPGYRAVPRRGYLWGALLECPDARLLNHADEACGFDVSLVNAHSTRGQFPLRLTTWDHRVISSPEQIWFIDLESEPSEGGAWLHDFTATHDGLVDGVVAWFELDVADGVRLSTHPSEKTHWMQAFMCFSSPVRVHAGARLTVSFDIEDDVRLVARPARPSSLKRGFEPRAAAV